MERILGIGLPSSLELEEQRELSRKKKFRPHCSGIETSRRLGDYRMHRS